MVLGINRESFAYDSRGEQKSTMTPPREVIVSVSLPRALENRLEKVAIAQDRTVDDLVVDYIEKALSDESISTAE